MQVNLSKMIRKLILLLFIISASNVHAQNEDALFWSSASFEGRISKNFNFEINAQLRFDDNMSQLASSLGQATIDYEWGKFIKISAGYRLSNSRGEYNYTLKHRFYSDLDFDYEIINNLDFEFRFRTQYSFDRLTALNEYILPESRTMFRFKYGFQYKVGDWKPSISNELFLNTQERLLTAYRINIGSSYKISKRHSLKLEYTFQKEIGGTRYIEHIYQIGYSYSLKGKLLDGKK